MNRAQICCLVGSALCIVSIVCTNRHRHLADAALLFAYVALAFGVVLLWR